MNIVSIFRHTLYAFSLGALACTSLVHAQSQEDLVSCPGDSTEVFRAFDTLACEYLDEASTTAAGAQAMLDDQNTDCLDNFGGRVLFSSIEMETSDTDSGQMVDTFRASLFCAKEIEPLDVFECPVAFSQIHRFDGDTLYCEFSDKSYESETLAEAEAVKAQFEEICTDTTAGLGAVSSSDVRTRSFGIGFLATVLCQVTTPRFGDFADDSVARACDASCTESIVQVRPCLNGGEVGGPGCTQPNSQTIERSCDTGRDRAGLCPLPVVPTIYTVPLLLLDDDEN